MTEKSGRKEQTRKKMVDAAGREFRRYGYAGIGVAGVAKAAGVTSGAFYDHFGSKDGAFVAAVDAGLDEVTDGIPKFQSEHGSGWVRAFADYYLGAAHRDDLAGGCAMTTLSPEVVRSNPEVHAVYEAKMTKITELIADGLETGTTDERRGRAWAMLGTLIGGLTIARAVSDPDLANTIASSIRLCAISAAGSARNVNVK